jgi:tRNA1(Val) A37 N6-methylase TrmN6
MLAEGLVVRRGAHGVRTMSDGLVELTEDAFLGGRILVAQPRDGFRAGLDSVLLAAAVPARPGERALELGLGAGTATLCLAARVRGLALSGLEIDEALARLARSNFDRNVGKGIRAGGLEIAASDITALFVHFVRGDFDHVFSNPPYFDPGSGTRARDQGDARARMLPAEGLAPWVECAVKALKPKGRLTMVNRAEALSALLALLDGRFGAIRVVPLWPGPGAQDLKPAKRILLTARKGSGAPMTLEPGILVHEADGSFTAPIEAMLKDGQSLEDAIGGLPWASQSGAA